jgi:hypothetical protein
MDVEFKLKRLKFLIGIYPIVGLGVVYYIEEKLFELVLLSFVFSIALLEKKGA